MASPNELERLVVRLVGDGTDYGRMIDKAQRDTVEGARKINKTTEEVERKQEKALDNNARSLKTVGRNVEHYGNEIKKTERKVTSFNQKLAAQTARLKSVAAGMRNVGFAMTAAFTLPAAGAGIFSVKAFTDFNSEMTKSTSIMGDLSEEVKSNMAETAKAISDDAIQQPHQLAEGYFFLASAGLSAQESMNALPKVTDFATAGQFDLATATDLLTDAQSALGLSTGNAEQKLNNMVRVSDVLVKANTLANASVEQFSTALTSKAGASLKTYNKTVEEGTAVLAAYADQGTKAELAGNSLDRVLRLLAKSAEKNKEAHKRLGFEVYDEATGSMRNMADIIENLENVTAGMSDEMRNATLSQLGFEARVQQAITPLIGLSDKIRDYQRQLEMAGGKTEEVSERQLKSLSAQLQIAWGRVKLIAQEFGSALAPAIIWVSKRLQSLIKWWRSLDKDTRTTIATVTVVVGGLVAAMGPLLMILGSVGFALSAIGPIASGVVTAFRLTKTASVALSSGLLKSKVSAELTSAGLGKMSKGLKVARIAMKGLLVAGAAFAGWQFGNWLADALNVGGLGDFNDEMERSIKLQKEFADKRGQRNSDILQKAYTFDAPGERKDFLSEKLETARQNLKGMEASMHGAQKEVERLNTTWNSWSGNKVLEVAKQDAKQANEQYEQQKKFVEQLTNAHNKATDAVERHNQKNKESTQVGKQAQDTTYEAAEAVREVTKRLEEQIDAYGKSAKAAEIMKLQQMGANEAHINTVKSLYRELEAKKQKEKQEKKLNDLMDQGKELTKQMRTPTEKLNDRKKELEKLLDAGAITTETYNRALADAKDSLKGVEKQTKKDYTADFKVTGVEGVVAGSATALAEMRQYLAGRNATPTVPTPTTPTQPAGVAPVAGGGGVASNNAQSGQQSEQAKDLKDHYVTVEDLLAQVAEGISEQVENTVIMKPLDMDG